MTARRVLVLGTLTRFLEELPASLDDASGLSVDLARRTSEALKKIGENTYDVAVCSVERPDELALVLRLRKANPTLPVLVQSGIQDPSFESLARTMGAASVCRPSESAAAFAEAVAAVVTSRLARQLKGATRKASRLSAELRSLAEESRERAARCRQAITDRDDRQAFNEP